MSYLWILTLIHNLYLIKFLNFPVLFLLLFVIQTSSQYVDAAGIVDQREAYFNGSVYLRLFTPMTLWGHSAVSFRTCRGKHHSKSEIIFFTS